MWKVLLLIGVFCSVAVAREQYKGQFDNLDPEIRQWFQSQLIPNGIYKGQSCCSTADGDVVEEDIRNGHYWIRWERHPEWMQVPDEVVLKEPNMHGRAIVWYYTENSRIKIRCYAPGSLL